VPVVYTLLTPGERVAPAVAPQELRAGAGARALEGAAPAALEGGHVAD
jgi:hypothetical protein